MAYRLLIFAFFKTYRAYPCSTLGCLVRWRPKGAFGQSELLRLELSCKPKGTF